MTAQVIRCGFAARADLLVRRSLGVGGKVGPHILSPASPAPLAPLAKTRANASHVDDAIVVATMPKAWTLDTLPANWPRSLNDPEFEAELARARAQLRRSVAGRRLLDAHDKSLAMLETLFEERLCYMRRRHGQRRQCPAMLQEERLSRQKELSDKFIAALYSQITKQRLTNGIMATVQR